MEWPSVLMIMTTIYSPVTVLLQGEGHGGTTLVTNPTLMGSMEIPIIPMESTGFSGKDLRIL